MRHQTVDLSAALLNGHDPDTRFKDPLDRLPTQPTRFRRNYILERAAGKKI
jgi:hypothetical protein